MGMKEEDIVFIICWIFIGWILFIVLIICLGFFLGMKLFVLFVLKVIIWVFLLG